MFDFTGVIIKVSPIIPVTGKFKEKCTFVVREEKGDREIAFLLFDSQIELFMKPVELGDKVKVTFSVKSREYQGSYTTNCFALNVEKLKEKQEQQSKYGNQSSANSNKKYQSGGDSPFNDNRAGGKFNSGSTDWQDFKRKQEEKKKKEQEDFRKKEEWEDFMRRQRQESEYRKEKQQKQQEQSNQSQYKQTTFTDHFSGVRTSDEAKKRYRELSKKFHPDMPGGSTEKMQEVNKQYERWK